jgi:hypothetical protein
MPDGNMHISHVKKFSVQAKKKFLERRDVSADLEFLNRPITTLSLKI